MILARFTYCVAHRLLYGLFVGFMFGPILNMPAYGSNIGIPPVNLYHGYVVARPQTALRPGQEQPTNQQAQSQPIFDASGKPISPMAGVKIYTGVGTGAYTFSNEVGRYGLAFYSPPCPSSSYHYRDLITAEFLSPLRPRYPLLMAANAHLPITVSCVGPDLGIFPATLIHLVSKIILDGISADVNKSRIHEFHFLMDSMFVVGEVRLTTGQDEDNDGKKDIVPVANETEFDDSGLLSSITKEDLEDTNIYIYNERTREQIFEQIKLMPIKPGDAANTPRTFQALIIGPLYDHIYRVMAEAGQTWISPAVFLNPAEEIFQASSRARPGDPISVIAINRATGYLGYKRTKLVSLGLDPNEQPGLDVTEVIIDMEPPNIKVKAQRDYVVKEGATKNQDRHYFIGSEGSAMTGDAIKIMAEWLAPDGSMLPPDLPGYTARISRIVKNQTLGQIHTLNISPGVSTYWTYVTNSGIKGDHIYVHLCAQSNGSGRTCTFEGTRSEDPWRLRPENMMPMKILEQGRKVSAGGGDEIPENMWIFRPELHFSIFDLNLQHIRLYENEGDNPININSPNETAFISWEDHKVDIVYRLRSPELSNNFLEALPRFGGLRQLAFVFGNENETAILDQHDTISFEDLEQLQAAMTGALPEELLSFRLVQSSDVGNVLWEWGFHTDRIKLTTSNEADSAAINSFTCAGGNVCGQIRAELIANVPENTPIVWQVEALQGGNNNDIGADPAVLPLAYGQTGSHRIGATATSVESGATINGQSGTGGYQSPWISQGGGIHTYGQGRFFSFQPDLSLVTHLPSTYRAVACPANQYAPCESGTNHMDVWRHNPRLGYKITAKITVNGQERVFTAQAKMDEIDVLRQEYINHNASAGMGLAVPGRGEFVSRSNVPRGFVEEISPIPYPYSVLRSDGIIQIWNAISTRYSAFIQDHNQYQGHGVPGNALIPTSGYRNPERNERVDGALASLHMLGRALDIAFAGNMALPSRERGILFGNLWIMVESNRFATADDWMLELRTEVLFDRGDNVSIVNPEVDDQNNNSIHDKFERTDHLHIEDET